LAELLVSEGDIVEQGAVIAKLRGTNFLTSVADLEDQILALRSLVCGLSSTAGAFEFAVSP
jgi:adhesin transport system membrane fusion protein